MTSFIESHRLLAGLVLLFLLSASCSKKSTSPSSDTGSLEAISSPPSARIYLDGVDTGKLTPSTIGNVRTGTHTVKLTLFTYFDTTSSVDVVKGQTAHLGVTLSRRPLPELQLTSNPGPSHNSSWSADGAKIAFDSYRSGAWNIFSMDSIGEAYGVTQLTTSLTDDHEPDWSPDNSKIALQSAGNIWSIDSKGQNFGSLQITADTTKDFAPVWSPSGLSIAFTSERIGTAIWIASSQGEGAGLEQVTDAAQPSRQPDWSPDGNSIIFSRFFENNWDIWTIDLRLTPYMPARLTRNTADDILPAISPDGSKIAFFSNRDGDSAIWVADSRGEDYGVVELVTFANRLKPAWSPDGTKITFCRWNEIWVITGLQ